MCKDNLIENLHTVAGKLNKGYLSRNEFEKYGKYFGTLYIRNFGSWFAACKIAGPKTIRSKEGFYLCKMRIY